MPGTAEAASALRDARLARFAALAAAVHVLEAGLPSPVPGIKPGLANIVTLIVLLRHGWRAAVVVTLLRVVLAPCRACAPLRMHSLRWQGESTKAMAPLRMRSLLTPSGPRIA